MNARSIDQQLERAGFFSEVRVQHADSSGRGVLVVLNAMGHEKLARLGMEGFQREVSRLAPGCVEEDAPWAIAPLGEHIWPPAALDRPHAAPRVLSHLRDEGTHRLLLEVTPELCWFQGHFPGQPILAGVAQLHLAALLARQLFGLTGGLREVTRLKFQHVVIPPRILDLLLESTSAQQVQFRYTAKERAHSQGRLDFSGDAQ